MTRTAGACGLILALTISCVSTPEVSAPPAQAEAAHSTPPREEAPQAPKGTQGRKSHLTKAELQLWNDPEFQRRFVESYKAETEIEPRVTIKEQKTILEVLQLMQANKLDDAAKLIQERRTEEATAVFDFVLANIHFQREELDQAAAAYGIAVQKFEKFRRAWKNLGVIHVRQSEFEKALPALTRVIELGGGDAVTYGLLGFSYSNVENNLAAESAYRMAILLDPKTVDWRMGLARSLFKQRRFADAVALCENLIASQPDRSDLWLLQANAYIGLKQPLKAAENYELVDRLGGSTAASLNMLGDIYINEEQYEMAVDSYLRALRKDPNQKPARAIRAAKVLTARGALQKTRRLLDELDKLYANKLEATERKDMLKMRARLAVAEGAGGEEARVLEEIVELDPMDGEALILLGQHSGRNGNPEKAIFYYERAAAIEKFEADAKIRHAQLLVGQGRYPEALPLLRRAQLLKPRDNVQKYLEQVERVAQSRK